LCERRDKAIGKNTHHRGNRTREIGIARGEIGASIQIGLEEPDRARIPWIAREILVRAPQTCRLPACEALERAIELAIGAPVCVLMRNALQRLGNRRRKPAPARAGTIASVGAEIGSVPFSSCITEKV
jgi:hypothetical protein